MKNIQCSLLFCFIFISLFSVAQTEPRNSNKRNYYLNFKYIRWESPTYENIDNVSFRRVPMGSIGGTISYRVSINQHFFQKVSLDFNQVTLNYQVNLDRGNYFPYYGLDSLKNKGSIGYQANFRAFQIGLNYQIGIEKNLFNNLDINFSSGLTTSSFFGMSKQIISRLPSAEPFSEPKPGTVAVVFNQDQSSQAVSGFRFHIPLSIELINKSHKIHYGIGFEFNYMIGDLVAMPNGIQILPGTSYYKKSATRVSGNNSALKFIVGF